METNITDKAKIRKITKRIKTFLKFLPIAVLQIAAGHLFQTPAALLINFLGRAVTLTIPYWAGRFSGSDRCNKDSFLLLSGGRNFGYDIRRLPVHVFRCKHYRARLTGFSALGVPYGPCGGAVCPLLHKKQ